MKSLASLILGLALATTLFVAGIATFAWLLSEKKPHAFANLDEKPLWTTSPVEVDLNTQSFERIAAAPVPPVFQAMAVDVPEHMEPQFRMAARSPTQEPGIDETTTGAVDPYAITDLKNTPHAQWCHQRYRSYQAEDNSYRSYSGQIRQCESPYMGEPETARGFHDVAQSGVAPEEALYEGEARDPGYTSAADGNAHFEWCLQRYSSYRPKDNTYQPYHGPRRACSSPFG